MPVGMKKVIPIIFEVYIHKIIQILGGNLNNFLY